MQTHCNLTLTSNGEILNTKVKATHPSLKEEALRVLPLVPMLKSTEQLDSPVKLDLKISILFQVE